MEEIWKRIEGYENYEVSNIGRVRRGVNLLKFSVHHWGHYRVQLVANKKRKAMYVARLVAQAFIPNEGENDLFVDHIDGDPQNNNVFNLRWCTTSQNNMNCKTYSNNTSGHKGITFDKDRKMWRVRLTLNNEVIHGGRFENFEEAVEVREQLVKKHFGEYARKAHKVPEIKEDDSFKEISGEEWREIRKYKGYEVSNLGRVRKGDKIFQLNKKQGYVVTSFHDSKMQRVHRLVAEAFIEKKDPNQKFVDHINCVQSDNRVENLRWVTQSQNMMNRKASRDNKSGYKGVYFNTGRWEVSITANGKTYYGGSFESKDDAIKKRKELEEEHFGEYAYKG